LISWREEDSFAGFMFVCVICHGMFFVREWLILGIALILYRGIQGIRHTDDDKGIFDSFGIRENGKFHKPVGIFVAIILLSLAGLLQPIRSAEGWLEAFRWLIFLIAYLWGRQLAKSAELKNAILHRIVLVSLLTTFLAWLPGSEWIWARSGGSEQGRFVATFGYANAAAVFFGCQLLLLLKDHRMQFLYIFVFAIGIVSTGSRTAVVLFVLFAVILISKRVQLKRREDIACCKQGVLGFYQGAVWGEQGQEIQTPTTLVIWKSLTFVFLVLILQQAALYGQGSLRHLLDWTDTSLSERIIYYGDSLRLAAHAYFLPRAGGWLAFPFIQTLPYWTLHPHSSICQIMLNQGLVGVIILGWWAVHGVKGYFIDLIKGKDLSVIGSKTAVLYLGTHSLLDVDISFGALGILFWILVGMNSK